MKNQLILFRLNDYKKDVDISHIKKTCLNCKHLSVAKSVDGVVCNSKKGFKHLHDTITSTFPFHDLEKESDYVGSDCPVFKPKSNLL